MSKDKKVVVTVDLSNMTATGELNHSRRTAVFDETTTVGEILDWARSRKDFISELCLPRGTITLSEDEISNPKKSLGDHLATSEFEDAV